MAEQSAESTATGSESSGRKAGIVVLWHTPAGRDLAERFVSDCRGKKILGRDVSAEMLETNKNLQSYNDRYLKMIAGESNVDDVGVLNSQCECTYAVAIYVKDERDAVKANLPLEVGMWLGYRGDHDLVILRASESNEAGSSGATDQATLIDGPINAIQDLHSFGYDLSEDAEVESADDVASANDSDESLSAVASCDLPGPPRDLGYLDGFPIAADGSDAFEVFQAAIERRAVGEVA